MAFYPGMVLLGPRQVGKTTLAKAIAARNPGALFLDLERPADLPQMSVTVAADTLHRFWRMLAHWQGQLFNASQLRQLLGGASHTTTARYLDSLVDTMLVRRLEPHLPNVGKRLVKSSKTCISDIGLLHALLNIANLSNLQGHPIVDA